MSVFTVGRLTRSEEENGRTELLRSMAIGRYAPAAAALIVATGMTLVVGALVTLGLMGNDLPAAGSVGFGVSYVACGLFFAALTTVAAEISENARVVYGISGAAIGAAYAIRAAGDAGSGALSWLSPTGWSQKMRPYADEVWCPALLGIVFGAALLALAIELASRRDLGGGLVPPRRGPPVAATGLGRPFGLARNQAGVQARPRLRSRRQTSNTTWRSDWPVAVAGLGMLGPWAPFPCSWNPVEDPDLCRLLLDGDSELVLYGPLPCDVRLSLP